MKLLEYEAKGLLSKATVSVPAFTLIDRDHTPSINFPVILKSQVPVGGRGKAGGVKIITDQSELQATINSLFNLPIKGFLPTRLLAEETLDVKHEYYISLIIDRPTATIRLIANRDGGIEVEDNSDSSYLNIEVTKTSVEAVGERVAECFDLPEQSFVLQDFVEHIYDCFVANDALLLEINPLILTSDDKIVAGDCKIELDDSAAYRHDWHFELKVAETSFVSLDETGTIATIANGAGLAMATVDAVADSGMIPANFLDIGGGANTDTVLIAFKRIVEYPNIKAIVVNIFAGITRCDEVATAIVAAKNQISDLPPLFIRLSGTNFDRAKIILDRAGIPLLSTLEDCLQAAKKVSL